MFFQIGTLKNFKILTGKHLCWSLLLMLSGKKKLQHRCFPVNNAKFSRTALFIEHLRWLFLYFYQGFGYWKYYFWIQLTFKQVSIIEDYLTWWWGFQLNSFNPMYTNKLNSTEQPYCNRQVQQIFSLVNSRPELKNIRQN